MDVKQVVLERLKAECLDGLFHPDGKCACLAEDLCPCGNLNDVCILGRKQAGCTCGEGCAWHVVDPNVKE